MSYFYRCEKQTSCSRGQAGLPRHRENREFESPFFQTGKTQGICFKKILKICFYTGNLPRTQGKFECLKNKKIKRTCNLSGWNYPLAVLCQDLGIYVILAAVLS